MSAQQMFVAETVVLDGLETRYLVVGDPGRDVVLLIHDGAWGGSAESTWSHLIPLLAENHYVIAPDLLGFGGSAKSVRFDRSTHEFRIQNVKNLLAHLNVGRDRIVHLVGNSFGGSLVLKAAAARSLPATSITSIAGTGGPWRSRTSLEELAYWDGTKEDLRRVTRLLVDDGSDVFEEHLETRLRWGTEPGHYRSMASVGVPLPPALKVRHADEWPNELRQADASILLVKGAQDELLEPDWTDHFTAAVPSVRVETMETRHAPNIDRSDALAALLVSFFEESKAR